MEDNACQFTLTLSRGKKRILQKTVQTSNPWSTYMDPSRAKNTMSMHTLCMRIYVYVYTMSMHTRCLCTHEVFAYTMSMHTRCLCTHDTYAHTMAMHTRCLCIHDAYAYTMSIHTRCLSCIHGAHTHAMSMQYTFIVPYDFLAVLRFQQLLRFVKKSIRKIQHNAVRIGWQTLEDFKLRRLAAK